jgi:hypothetical protein
MPAKINVFNMSLSGSGSVGSEAWVDLGSIPVGQQIWIGFASYTSPDKAIIFELRGNNTGESSGATGTTTLYSSASVRRGSSADVDLYRRGRIITRTVVGTGVEHWWLRLVSKSGTSGAYLYTIAYTLY